MNNCLNCLKETPNPKYCCRSCSASTNNRLVPKRNPEGTCKNCKISISTKYTYCSVCWKEMQIDWDRISYMEVTGLRSYQKNSRIRNLARVIYQKSDKPKLCVNCGYDKHYEVCHIKGISEHSPETFVSTINDLSNLISLCRNCHWELDKGDLTISDIYSRRLP